MKLLIHGAKEIVQVTKSQQLCKVGKDMDDVAILTCFDEGLSIAVDSIGKIAGIGTDSDIKAMFEGAVWEKVIDASGKSVIPGLVDAHTHPVWAGDRVHEFAMKLAGASYLEVHEAGGGIHFTVNKTREANEEELLKLLIQRLEKMSRSGTTLVECKSGYGLDLETELKMLRVLEKARQSMHIGISSTFCGAHAVPRGKTSQEATEDLIKKQLPAVRKLRDAGELLVDSVDVFCEKGVFEVEETRKILTLAKEMGFLLNFHAEELNYIGGVEMGASLGAEAMSHLEEISEQGIKSMAKSGSVAVLLPTTAFILRLRQPPARKLIEEGVPVSLGSDFNPNAHCLSMPLVMHLACVQMRLTLNEALVAATLNAARSLRRSHEVGSLEVGKWADILVLNSDRYFCGCCSEELKQIIKPLRTFARGTQLSSAAHDYVVQEPAIRTSKFYDTSIPRTSRLWNPLPAHVFPAEFDLQSFKSSVFPLLRNS